MLHRTEYLNEVGRFLLDEDVLGLAARFEREGVVDLCTRRRASDFITG